MSETMLENFPDVNCIIDCVEFEVTNSLYLHKMIYSDYKTHTTVKALVDIAPSVRDGDIDPLIIQRAIKITNTTQLICVKILFYAF